MDPSTRFDDGAIRRILDRAAERQEQAERALPAAGAGSAAGPEPGLTLAELQDVAREVGIAPAHVQAAARELALRADHEVDRYPFLGIPKEIADRRVVAGTLSDRDWEQIVLALREEFNLPGSANSFGEVREWFSTGPNAAGPPVHLRLAPGDDGWEVSLRQSSRNSSVVTHSLGWTSAAMTALFAVMFALGTFDPGAIMLPVASGIATGGVFAGGRLLARRWARRTRDRFARLLDRIERTLRGGSSSSVST